MIPRHFIKRFFKMKKLLMGLATVTGSVVALAEGGTSGSSGPDFSAATTQLTSVSSALADWVETAAPLLGTIAAAFLVFWLGKMLFRLVKGWASAAK